MKSTNCEYEIQDERAYGVMVLAYDLLHDEFVNANLECDIVFNTCNEIMDYFLKSEEFDNFKLSFYDALKLFIEDKYMEVIQ